MLLNLPKTSKIEPQGVSQFNFGSFWEPIWLQFYDNFDTFFGDDEKRAGSVIPK